ncbi:MAG TPA: type VI secretion system contractile sheath small subunit [Candidatus Angelobacter sp.]|nr:type VI secretion system contractile sheath small subunit [Candidatus Angelobacter sp.]
MPIIDVKRQGVRPAVRKAPTSTCAVTMPMTLDRVSREVRSETEEPQALESLQDAFEKFKPELKFRGSAGEEGTEFRADLQFRGIKDFDPNNIMTRQEVKAEDGSVTYLRNDLADLKNNIDLLYRLKDRWKLPAVRRAWNNPEQRREIIRALSQLRDELGKVATQGAKNG